MAGNSLGKILTLSSFGESHGPAVGGVLDGFPPNIKIDFGFIQSEVNRRKPGNSFFTTTRSEDDFVRYISGIFDGRSTGAPIAFLITNENQRPEDYQLYRDLYRPSHADFTYDAKYGIRDYRGGGRASARETLVRVVGGAFAKLLLKSNGITVSGYVNRIGNVELPDEFRVPAGFNSSDTLTGCPDPETEKKMLDLLSTLKEEGDTTGGIITCRIVGVPAGLGEPVFDKLQADLAKAMLGINAAKGFEYGSGFAAASMRGSQHNDPFVMKEGKICTSDNRSGGIQGGISNGEEIFFRVAFKPVATLMTDQQTVSRSGESAVMKGKGRHDTCFVPRAVPIVEAMAAFVIADHLLRYQAYRLLLAQAVK